jgi:hypothetical protein
MKKFFLVILLIGLASLAEAQGGFCLGPKIGYNSNTLSSNLDSIKAGINNSLQIGAFVRVGKKLYLQPEANYQTVSGTFNQGSGANALSQDYTLKSIKVPVLIGFKLIDKAGVNLRLLAGPAFTFSLDKKLNPSSMGELWPIQSVDDFKNSSWSAQMGAGIDVLFLTLDLRYEMGIENIYGGSGSTEIKNNMFNISLGVKFL